MEQLGFALPVVEAHCEYRQPAHYDDELEIRTLGQLLSPVRVKFTYEVVRPADSKLLATGHTVHGCTGADGRLMRIPDDVRTIVLSEPD